MQTRKRVYPSERKPAKWVSYSLLFLSAVILFSGVAARSGGDAVFETVATPSPIPLDAAFDETRETREITLNGSVWYALQLGAFETEEAARQLAEQFQRRGAAGYLWPEERFRVLAAVYPEKEDAQAVRQQLRDQHDVDSYLFEISIPSVSLRMTGMRGQIDILEAAFLHAEELIRQMERIRPISPVTAAFLGDRNRCSIRSATSSTCSRRVLSSSAASAGVISCRSRVSLMRSI